MQKRIDPFLTMASLYLSVGLLALLGRLTTGMGLIETLPRLRWLLIHFVTIGAMTQALFGLLPSLLASVGATESRPTNASRWRQWLLLNVGFPTLLVGMAAGSTTTAVVGGSFVLLALVSLTVTVFRLSSRPRGRLGRFYRTAPWFLVVGVTMAFGMLLDVHGPGGYFGSIEAHVHANVWGFLALVAAGTLLHLVPALDGTTLRYPTLVPVTYWGLTLGAIGLVSGPWLAFHALTFGGLSVYVVGTVALLVNVVGTRRASGCRPDARIGHVLGAYLWLVVPVPFAPLVLLFPTVVPGAPIETAAINGLVFGWMLQLAMAFLPVAAASADGRPWSFDLEAAAERAISPSWVELGTLNVGMVAIWLTALPPFSGVADALTLGGFSLVALAWGVFLRELWTALVADSGRGGNASERPRSTGESAAD
ncbi:hypothetical protein V5735_00885 (plasmid) [Haladaptatus sp. SPP-AMP-3]|uniref:hypothetical protein n=1 Tax=Haladaptatus sp. SPP-AMP-3 TaxID=3121295 RepID=UPI003C2E7DBF